MTNEAIGVPSGTNRGMSEWTWQDYLKWGQEINQERMRPTGRACGTTHRPMQEPQKKHWHVLRLSWVFVCQSPIVTFSG